MKPFFAAVAALLALGGASGALAGPPAAPQSDEDLAARIANNPLPESFQIYGLTPPPKARKDKSVQYEQSVRVAPPGSGDPWAVGINVPLTKPVKAGDKLIVLVWARLEAGAGGATSAPINAQIQLSSAPYTQVFAAPLDVGKEWKLHQIAGRADKDYAKGTLAAAFHVNTGRHVFDIGPVAVMNMGQ